MTVKPFNADPRIRGDRPYAFAAVVLSTDADGFLTDATIEPRIRYAATPSGVTGENSGSLILDADGSGQPYVINASGTAVSLGSLIAADGLDLNGASLILDADGDTSITVDTDDQIDIALSGADDFRFTANTFTALSGSTIATNNIAETTAANGVSIDGVLLKDGSIVCADGGDVQTDSVTEATADAGVTIEGVLLKDSGIVVPDGGAIELRERATSAGAVALRFGGIVATEGVELFVAENTVSPAAVETAICTVPAGAVILSVQANCESALTGGGTTVTWAIGTTADPDKYGYPGSDTLAQNSKVNTIPAHAVLASPEAIVLSAAATGGTADGDTALTVGSVRVVVTYFALNSLADT